MFPSRMRDSPITVHSQHRRFLKNNLRKTGVIIITYNLVTDIQNNDYSSVFTPWLWFGDENRTYYYYVDLDSIIYYYTFIINVRLL